MSVPAKLVSRRAFAVSVFALGISLFASVRVEAQNQPMKFERIPAEFSVCFGGMVQDRYGFLWFGAWNGLYRYDGYSFSEFRNGLDNPHSLSDNTILAMLEDRAGVFWIGTGRGGLNRFDPETGNFTSYQHDPHDSTSLSFNTVKSIYEDRTGVLWLGTLGGGLNKLVPPANHSEKASKAARATFISFKNDPTNPNSLSNNSINAIYEDRVGTLWIGTFGGGLNKFDREQQSFTSYKQGNEQSNYINKIFEDHAGELWITSLGGLSRFDRHTGKFTLFLNDPNDPKSLSHNYALPIVEYPRGELWIGTLGGGLNKFNRETAQFTRY